MPINASVAITPRTRSLDTASVIACADRLVDHRSATRRRRPHACAPSSRVHSGCSSVGHSRDVTHAAASVELVEARLVTAGADRAERRRRSDQQPGPAAGRGVGRVRRVAAPHQPHPGAEVVDDAPGQQAHQIRVARQPRVDAVERVRRHRRTADVVEPLQHLHPPARAGQVCGSHQPVVPAADDDDVACRRSGGSGVGRLSRGSPRPRRRGRTLALPGSPPVSRSARRWRSRSQHWSSWTSSARSRWCSSDSSISWCCSLARSSFSSATSSLT